MLTMNKLNVFFDSVLKVKSYLIIGACQLILIAVTFFIYDTIYKTHIGIVNITGVVDEFIKRESQNNITAEELKKLVQAFGITLEKGLHEIGKKQHVVLLPAEAVITGAKDYTPEMQKYLTKHAPILSYKSQITGQKELDQVPIEQHFLKEHPQQEPSKKETTIDMRLMPVGATQGNSSGVLKNN